MKLKTRGTETKNMTFIVVDNLRGFFTSRPPLVMFMVCLASFAIALITFAYVVRTRDMPNPDVTEDWNTFLTKFSNLEFCVDSSRTKADIMRPLEDNSTLDDGPLQGKKEIGEQHPADMLKDIHERIKDGTKKILGKDDNSQDTVDGAAVNPTPPPNAPASRISKRDTISVLEQQKAANSDTATPLAGFSMETSTHADGSYIHFVNVTLPLNMEIAPNMELRHLSLQNVRLMASVSGNTLMLNEAGKKENVQIFLSFPRNLSESNCVEWEGKVCSLYVINTCVTFSGPATVFPHAQRPASSQMCEDQRGVSATDDALQHMTARPLTLSSNWCAAGSRLTAEFSFDEALTVLLSQQDRSMVNLHLMRTSYFLFVMVITLFCYAMVRGRPGKVKTIHVPYEKVSTTGM